MTKIDDDRDPDSTIERFVALWLHRYFPTELNATFEDAKSESPLVDRLQHLFCSQICKLLNAEHHADCQDQPERWFDLVATNLLMQEETSKVGAGEMLLGLLTTQLEKCDWFKVENEIVNLPDKPDKPNEPPKPKRLFNLPVIAIDPVSNERAQFRNATAAAEALNVNIRRVYDAIAGGSDKLNGKVWSYRTAAEHDELPISNTEELQNV